MRTREQLDKELEGVIATGNIEYQKLWFEKSLSAYEQDTVRDIIDEKLEQVRIWYENICAVYPEFRTLKGVKV